MYNRTELFQKILLANGLGKKKNTVVKWENANFFFPHEECQTLY